MENKFCASVPLLFTELNAIGCLSEDAVWHTSDGFWAVTKSISDILAERGVTAFLNDRNQERRCSLFYDDWYLYAVPSDCGYVYSLYKMREQEHDAENGFIADGDTPGVTVSFIAFCEGLLRNCLNDPSSDNRRTLSQEIERVVSKRHQHHHEALKAYFIRPQAQGSYLIAELYVSFLAGLAENGCLPLPNRCASLCRASSRKKGRLARFLSANNKAAGYPVCDGEAIHLRDPRHLTPFEKNALLASHAADTSFHSFAAEVRFHACFLHPLARLPLPFLGRSLYDSAIRADMTIGENAAESLAPFHNPRSRWVRLQRKYHSGRDTKAAYHRGINLIPE